MIHFYFLHLATVFCNKRVKSVLSNALILRLLKKNCSQTKYLLYHDMIFYGGLIANTCYKRTFTKGFSHCLMFHRERFGAINTNNESLVPIFDEFTEERGCQVASSPCCALSLSLSISRSLSFSQSLSVPLYHG